MPYINIRFKEDLRCFKKDDEHKFDLSDKNYIIIVGENGSGKSTLINTIRDYRCDNKSDLESNEWSMKLGYNEIKGFKDKVNIDTDFKKIFFVSSEFDDPNALYNSASANSYIAHGGYGTKNMSNGQRNFTMLGKWLTENKDNFDKDTLLVFDEADKGFELKYQTGFITMLNNFNKDYGCKSLVITHNVIPIVLTGEVYDIHWHKIIKSNLYMYLQTGYDFNVNKEPNVEDLF